jgi:hypothetical protein
MRWRLPWSTMALGRAHRTLTVGKIALGFYPWKRDPKMTLSNEQIIRNGNKTAEDKDIARWVAAFAKDGTFTDDAALLPVTELRSASQYCRGGLPRWHAS